MTIILDPGHGGIINGEYQTKGKRSPKRQDGSILYEGVNNRRIVELIKEELIWNRIKFIDIVNSQEDKKLSKRIKEANQVEGEKIYLSIHSNAAGSGWTTARGFGTYIFESPSKKSKEFAEIIHKHLAENLTKFTKDRGIRKRNFAVLRETNHPAVLLELGFHNNLEESYLIESEEWSLSVVKSIVSAIKEIISIFGE